jgi:GT2 family glycosyltransferase
VNLYEGLREHPIEVPAAVVAAESFDLINNAGTALSATGEAADRGIFEPDRGQYDREEDLEAVCGAAALFRRSALEDVGLFDRDFFMYYEDTDLSWRLRAAGYRLLYQPRSTIRHRHAASSVEWSPLFTFYTARNKVLMIVRNGGARASLGAYARELALLLRLLVVWWRSRRGPGAARARGELATRLRVHCSLLLQIPRALSKRAGLLGDRLR